MNDLHPNMQAVMDSFPREIRDMLEPISAIGYPARQGMTANVIFVESGVGQVVVKHAKGNRVAALRHEQRVLQTLTDITIPVPELLAYLENQDEPENDAWLVMNRLPGETVLAALKAEQNENRRAALISHLGQMISKLHATPVPPGLVIPRRSWLDEMLQLAADNLETGIGEGSAAQLAWLRQHPPAAVTPVLIHGDLFLDNVLTKNGQITGLIDWAFGAAGDPRYDLALAMYDLSPQERSIFLAAYSNQIELTPLDFDYFLILGAFY